MPWRMVAVWGALFFNVLAFYTVPATVVAIPSPVGQLMTQASLVLAVGLALSVNPHILLRPNLFLVLLSVLGVAALAVSIHSEFYVGSVYRSLRLLGFLTVLWLLSPWWGRHDMLLLRLHRRVLWLILGSVLLGAALAPGLAFEFQGRLSGVIWPIPPTQVAHYAAVVFGTTAVLWMCRVLTGRHALLALSVSGAMLLSTHTRTALVAMVLGLLVAAASLFLGHVRVRRVSALGALGAVMLATVFASELTNWILRGQTTQEAGQLTGRTRVWAAVFDHQRPRFEQLFGSGMSDQSFNGLPIDSNWVATYLDQGWFGLVVQAAIIVTLLLMAATRPRGPQRAAALFLIMYCLVASFTETGLGAPSAYMLDLTVAAALLAPQARRTAP
ncbi:MAG TPA: hypothetical protein VK964_03925 [Nocardioidaceae bacterium]|nr:hypothetical protein [Nocardioidaceae bacterium]